MQKLDLAFSNNRYYLFTAFLKANKNEGYIPGIGRLINNPQLSPNDIYRFAYRADYSTIRNSEELRMNIIIYYIATIIAEGRLDGYALENIRSFALAFNVNMHELKTTKRGAMLSLFDKQYRKLLCDVNDYSLKKSYYIVNLKEIFQLSYSEILRISGSIIKRLMFEEKKSKDTQGKFSEYYLN